MALPERQRGRGKIRPGDSKRLKPYTSSNVVWRSLFRTRLADDAVGGREREYAVDIDYFDFDGRLYIDGEQAAVAMLPAKFPVPGGVIDVDVSFYGARRMHFVPDDGSTEFQLSPDPRSGEAMRARFGQRHPVASRIIGWAAILVLLTALALLVPQIIDQISHMQVFAERFGTFTSPIQLPGWANLALTVGGVLASLERGLTLRNHWLIDAETWWLED